MAIASMEREQVLRIEANGNICMEISSTPPHAKTVRDGDSDKSESPVVPVVREHSNVGKVGALFCSSVLYL